MKTYLISNGTHVKIGKSNNPNIRIAALQTASPTKLTLILILDGDQEKSLHKRFAESRTNGEWFTLSAALTAYIEECTGFRNWLFKQKDRDDPIGDLANDAIGDKKFPQASDYKTLKWYLLCHQTACRQARIALTSAYRMWQVEKRGGR